MSRIGNYPIPMPQGVEFKLENERAIVKGPKGELSQVVDSSFDFAVQENAIVINRPSDSKPHRTLHGTYRALVKNMVTGVSDGFQTTLEFVGVGYRVEVNGQVLKFALGFSHPVVFVLPPEITAESIYEKGKNPRLILRGASKELLGQVVAKIREIRPPEPYKGKGIRFEGEDIRRKEGKAAGKK